MLKLGASNAEVGGLDARGVKLRFRLGNRFIRVDSGLEEHLRQVQGLLENNHGRIEQFLQGILTAQFIVVDCKFRLRCQPSVFEVSGGDLRARDVRFDCVPDTPPKVGRPGRIEGEYERRELPGGLTEQQI